MTLTLRESFEVFEENLPEIRRACLDNAKACMEENSPYKEWDIDTEPTKEAMHLHTNYVRIETTAKELFQTVRRIDSYRQFKDNPHTPADFVTDQDIQNAREAEPDWFIYEASLSTKRPHKGVCPFHPDKDPSLTLMKSKKTGNYYLKCFPCQEHWDSIGFLMKRDGVDFMKAVKMIIGS